MPLKRSEDGLLYGTAPVILSREKDGEIEHLIGSSAPFGGVMCSTEFEGKRFTEEPKSWWEAKGFTVTESPALQMAREAYWDSRDAEKSKAA